jgi:hypothetical protein
MADRQGLIMSAFKMFDPYGYLASGEVDTAEARPITPMMSGTDRNALATLAGLAAGQSRSNNLVVESRPVAVASRVSAAKAANVAKYKETEDQRNPALLRDGRRLWRFRAGVIPDQATDRAGELIDEAQRHGVVLVADGFELILVERWLSSLSSEILDGLRHRPGEVIAALRSRACGVTAAAAPNQELGSA